MNFNALTTHEVFEHYDRRFAAAMAALPDRKPWLEADRAEIRRLAKKCLGIKDEWIPDIRPETVRVSEFTGFNVEHIQFTSWPGVTGTAHLYVPEESSGKPRAFVMLCCGHGGHGKLYPSYQAMARHIVRRGAMVLVPDNIGQGERLPMGHADAVIPFACGTSLQGLVVMETLGWVRRAMRDKRVDKSRMAAIGNSGGGTLTLFMGALCPDLAALSSSGYPSTFEFVARKEKKLCACNIIPKIVGELEMWHLYGCFAPKPFFIFQGKGDNMFPPDIFYQTARKIARAYARLKAGDNFKFEVVEGAHSWDSRRNRLLGDFLSKVFNLSPAGNLDDPAEDTLLPETDACFPAWPAGALAADELARQITGVKTSAGVKLWDIFPPACGNNPVEQITPRGDTRLIMAQFEAFLKPGA
jgi:dienelactone hydrolase